MSSSLPSRPSEPEGVEVGAPRGLARWAVRLGVVLIRGYQLFISPLLGAHCRFEPSCSAYAREALEVHGPFKGLSLALRRILRCRPGGGLGYDPVPPRCGCQGEE